MSAYFTQIYALPNLRPAMKGFLPRTLHPGLQLLLLVAFMALGFCVAYAVIFAWAMGGFGLSVGQLMQVAQNPAASPQGWGVLMMMQGVALFVALAGGALALASALGYRWAEYFNPR